MRRKGLGRGLGQGYRNLVPMDSHVHSLSARGVKSSPLTMTKKAYADISMDFEKARDVRDVSWGGTGYVSIDELEKSLKFVSNYNNFDADLVFTYLKKHFPDLKYKFGREGSPVLYVKGDRKRLEELQAVADDVLMADEYDFTKMTIQPNYYPGRERLEYQSENNNPMWQGTTDELRLWWD